MNRLTLAVAGSRKTQSIVDECVENTNRRALVLTYTTHNQAEVRSRLAAHSVPASAAEVMGWYEFLITHIVRPYLPLLHPHLRVTGFAFDGPENRYLSGVARHFTSDGAVYKKNLAKLAHEIAGVSGPVVVERLSQIYDIIYVDEVQDLCGWDLEILQILLDAPFAVSMVGDVRQSLMVTNPEDPKNRQYQYMSIQAWFDEQARKQRLEIVTETRTWRSSQQIADFADSIFPASFGFPATTSMSTETASHRGIFTLDVSDLDAYVAAFEPLCLRHSAASWATVEDSSDLMNFGVSKGLSADHVVVCATGAIERYLATGSALETRSASALYVAVTRARFSVAFLVKRPDRIGLPQWHAARR